ncbi:MAG: hypothetical protein ACC649_08805, partial [Myxococcota bacterium]
MLVLVRCRLQPLDSLTISDKNSANFPSEPAHIVDHRGDLFDLQPEALDNDEIKLFTRQGGT